jgi:hypothetical protein
MSDPMTFSVEYEWENGTGISDAALSATWARISIRIGPSLVRVYD